MAMAFGDTLEMGQQGERVAAEWLRSRGCGVLPTCDLVRAGLYSGPSLTVGRSEFVVPDLQVYNKGIAYWLEVKTKTELVWWGKGREWRVGFDAYPRNYLAHYLGVQKESGLPGYVVFLVGADPTGRGPALYWQSLDWLDQNKIEHDRSASPYKYGKRLWFWNVRDMPEPIYLDMPRDAVPRLPATETQAHLWRNN